MGKDSEKYKKSRPERSDFFDMYSGEELLSDDDAADSVVAVVVVDAEEIDTVFDVHVDGVDFAVEVDDADELAGHIVDSEGALSFNSDVAVAWVRIDDIAVGVFGNCIDVNNHANRDFNVWKFSIVGFDNEVSVVFRFAQTDAVEGQSDVF